MKAALPLISVLLMLAACVPSRTAPTPVPAPASAPVQRATAARPAPVPQAPAFNSWMDAPATAGSWQYARFPFGSQALFVSPAGTSYSLTMSCIAAERQVIIQRPVRLAGSATATVRSETATRSFSAQPAASGMTATGIALSPSDPLLDAVALSKGRFAVETDGLPTLYLPSHAEVSRVIEDCR